MNFVVFIADRCRRFALPVTLFFLAASGTLGCYAAHAIAINTNIDQLMEEDLDWRMRERELAAAFPQNTDRLVIVIDARTADLAEHAASTLAAALSHHDTFMRVTRPDARSFFLKNGLLFLSEEELARTLDTLIEAQPMLGSLAADPSLRGLFRTLTLAARGAAEGQTDAASLSLSFSLLSEVVEAGLAGKMRPMPWQSAFSGRPPSLRETRKFIVTQPVMDFKALSPGAEAQRAVREAAQRLELTPDNGVRVRMTGSVALNDEEFASVAQGIEIGLGLSLFFVMLLLFSALRSWRIIAPILIVLLSGLIATTSFALAVFGSLNLISVAFAVLFVGTAVDFGIQFGVRYREERHHNEDPAQALRETARALTGPLSFAAAATALGLASFMPTDYRGVAELGLIAAFGMLVALALNLTFLPALLALTRPRPEREPVGYAWAAPADDFLARHRKRLLPLFALLAIGSVALASQIRFDFDPLNLKDPKSESVSTLFDIMKDPDASPTTIEILAPSLKEAQERAKRLEALDEVSRTITLASFVPNNQEKKLSLIADAKFLLDPSLSPSFVKPAPTEKEVRQALFDAANALRALGPDKTAAQALAAALEKAVASDDPALFERLDDSMIRGMKNTISRLRVLLNGAPARLDDIDPELRRDWVTPDGRAKIEVHPKGNARDPEILASFTQAVRALEPEASGAPVSIRESGRTIMNSFIQAGLSALVAIALLALVVLRRIGDVLRLLAPLILSGILTLATMAVFSMPLTFANVIALPLLLSLGVSYAVYFISYWRNGQERPLSSPMARAVFFSAATTFVAFWSLSLSSHMGTRGMGQLLTIALLYCVLCSFSLLPALLGRPPMR